MTVFDRNLTINFSLRIIPDDEIVLCRYEVMWAIILNMVRVVYEVDNLKKYFCSVYLYVCDANLLVRIFYERVLFVTKHLL